MILLSALACVIQPLHAYAGTANPAGVGAAQSLISKHPPTLGGVKSILMKNMPASGSALTKTSKALHSVTKNPAAMKSPSSIKQVQTMMKATTSKTGQCTITDTRVYCETASLASGASASKKIVGLPRPYVPSISMCKKRVTPPKGFSSADLVTASGKLNLFSGKLTCNYNGPTAKVLVKKFSSLWLSGRTFISLSHHQTQTSFMSTSSPSVAVMDSHCKATVGIPADPNAVLFKSVLISW